MVTTFGPNFSIIRREYRAASGSSWGRWQAFGYYLPWSFRVKHRVQQLIKRGWFNAQHGFTFRDYPFLY
jgi:hypothetical protein